MSLVCPECKEQSFSIVGSVECGPGGGADENTIQHAQCKKCNSFFFCVYKSTRSFRSDRGDRVIHLAFLTDQKLWSDCADIFEEPSSKISSEQKIEAAMAALSKAQETGVSGKHIKYAYTPMPEQSTQTQGGVFVEFFKDLMYWYRNRRS